MKRKMTITYLSIILLLAFFSASCSSEISTEVPSTETPTATSVVSPVPEATSAVEEIAITTPTPKATPLPGIVTDAVEKITDAVGINETVVLGLRVDGWINLGVSILFILFGIFIGWRIVIYLLRKLVQYLRITPDQDLLKVFVPHIRWMVNTLFIEFAVNRLLFIPAGFKEFLHHFYFTIYLIIGVSILWILIDYAIDTYVLEIAERSDASDIESLENILPLLHRVAHIILAIFGIQVLLSRFGVEIGAMATALGIGGLAISLAAQDVLGDLIAGFIILISQPYRIGDRIEIQGLDTWGDVVSIGSRTTSIRTRDNRLVIVPNSIIGKSQVVNYTFPDPRYRVQFEIGIGYGQDIEKVRELIVDTVRQVEGVLKDKPVDALYVTMGASAMTFRVRWWIESYIDTRQMFDAVNTALQAALDEAGIESPFPTQDINLRMVKNDEEE